MLRLVLCAGVTWRMSVYDCSSVFVVSSFTFIVQFHQYHRVASSLLQSACECVLLVCIFVYTCVSLEASNDVGLEVNTKKSKHGSIGLSPSTEYRSLGQ
jgi:hypothetical protein